MKKVVVFAIVMLFCYTAKAQSEDNTSLVKKACLNYIEGFYEGSPEKLQQAIRPNLDKFGYTKKPGSTSYQPYAQMTYEKAIAYAKRVAQMDPNPYNGAIKKVEVLDVMEHIASAKITAKWGTDYLLLSKDKGVWRIEKIIWQGK